MRRSAAEWRLLPSRRQRWLNLAVLGLIFVAVVLLSLLTALLAVPLLGLVFYRSCRLSVERIGVDADSWWVHTQGQKRQVVWRSGSQRLDDHLYLVWGFWPWQTLHLNKDSFISEDDFRRLKMALYGSL